MRGGAKGENTHFHFLFSELVGGFQSNSVGIILRGERPKFIHVEHVAPRGAQGEGPQGENKKFVFQIINHYSQDTCILYVDIFIDEEYNLFMARPVINVINVPLCVSPKHDFHPNC